MYRGISIKKLRNSCLSAWDSVWIQKVREKFDNHLLNARNLLEHNVPIEKLDKDSFKLVDGKENIPKGSVLFASTHQGILDGFVYIPFIPRHCVILHGASVRTVLKLAQINTGLILVDKNSKESRQNAKLDMIKILIKGHSIMYFPEGTWNLSPNKLHLPISFGFLDIARKAEAAVVPMVMEYSYDSTKTRKVIHIGSR